MKYLGIKENNMFKPINIKEYFNSEIEKLKSFAQAHPFKLGIIDATAEDDIGNQIYIKKKVEDFRMVGWDAEIHKTNDVREGIHEAIVAGAKGIIVQLPVREGVEFNADMIPIDYDCDGLVAGSICDPATPRGIIDYLEDCGFEFEGKHAVVIGRSEIVGKPMAQMLLNKNCTVTVMHSKSDRVNMYNLMRGAELVICAVGKPHFLKRYMCPCAFVVDVGINRGEDGKLCGDFKEDLDFYYGDLKMPSTPVPGGVGLLTRLALLKNCKDLVEEYE